MKFSSQRLTPNTTVERTACKLRLQVPSALRAPAAAHLRRWALNTMSINKHFKTEGWLIPALMALPIAIGLIAAIFFA